MKVAVKGVLMEVREIDKGEKGKVYDGYLFQEGQKILIQARSKNNFWGDKTCGEVVDIEGNIFAWTNRDRSVSMMVLIEE
jgi:hypothetical protein